MSYMNNDDYLRFSRTEEYQTNLKNANFDLTKVLKDQNNDAAGYDGLWGEGIKMNWTKVPLEEQRCHINWRQSINDDGIALSSTLLASWMEQGGSINGGSINGVSLNGTNNNIEKANIYEENQKDMSKEEHQNNEDYGEYIKSAIQFAKDKREKGEHLMSSDHEIVKKLLGNATDLDAFAVIAAAIALDKENDYNSVISAYRQYATSLNTTNPVLIWTAMGTSDQIVKAYLDGTLDSDGKVTSSTVTSKKTSIPAPNVQDLQLEMAEDVKSCVNQDVIRIAIHHTTGNAHIGDAAKDYVFNLAHDAIYNYAYIGQQHLDGYGMPYNYLISNDGTIYLGRPEEYYGCHTPGYNIGSIGISCIGSYNSDELTQEAINSLISLCADICHRKGIQASRDTIKGHEEWTSGSLGVWSGCPGNNVGKQLDSIVQAVASGSLSMTVKLWTQFATAIKKGLENGQTTAKVSGLDLFPKICFLYVALEASAVSTVSASFDTQEWGFPMSDEDIRRFGNGTIIITDVYGSHRDYGGHSGIDLQPSGMALPEGDPGYRTSNVPIRAMNDGTVIEAVNDLSGVNTITIVHRGNKMSRYKHCYNHQISVGDSVRRGQIISYMSGVGGGAVDTYPFHLHVEMGKGTNLDNYQHFNPIEGWAKKADMTNGGAYNVGRFTLSS